LRSVSLERFGGGHHNLFIIYCFDAAAAHETDVCTDRPTCRGHVEDM
jgi:hypothetical protein